jgi:hypothetical protein
MERFNLTLNELEGKEEHSVEVSDRFAALEDLDAEVEINIKLDIVYWFVHLVGSVDMKNPCSLGANIVGFR